MTAAIARTIPLATDAPARIEGDTAIVQLDPAKARARAEQQGLPDPSVKAAAQSRRVHDTVRRAIAAVNASHASPLALRRCILLDEHGAVLAKIAAEEAA